MRIIIGNICSLLAMLANAFSSTRKTSKGMLHVQNVGQAIYFAGALAFRGYSAGVQNVIGILRNLTAIKGIKSKVLEWSLVAAGVLLGVAFNNRGIMGLLPVFANLEYTLVIFRFSTNERALKLAFLVSSVCYVIFNVVIQNYVGAVMDAIVLTTTAVSLLRPKPA